MIPPKKEIITQLSIVRTTCLSLNMYRSAERIANAIAFITSLTDKAPDDITCLLTRVKELEGELAFSRKETAVFHKMIVEAELRHIERFNT